jgi:hypothetical protein
MLWPSASTMGDLVVAPDNQRAVAHRDRSRIPPYSCSGDAAMSNCSVPTA